MSFLRSNVQRGVLAGLITGLVFGVLLEVTTSVAPTGNRVAMMELIAELAGTKNHIMGWAYHLFDNAIMGAIFGAVLGKKINNSRDGLKYGLLYGLGWWALGGLVLRPFLLGMSVFSPQTVETIRHVGFQILISHILFGLVLGGIFAMLTARSRKKTDLREVRREEEPSRFKVG